MAPELCTIVVTLMMNVGGAGWKPITKYLTMGELSANIQAISSFSRGEEPAVQVKDVIVLVDGSKPFDCVTGPPVRLKK